MPTDLTHRVTLTRAQTRRLEAFARAKDLELPAALALLIIQALDQQDARAAGAAATNRSRTKAERSEAARRAVQARWAKRAPGGRS